MICKVCQKNINARGFGNHLKKIHNLTSKEYYDKFYKSINEGICPVCNKNTKFRGITNGYATYCSSKCVGLDTTDKRKETCLKKYGVDNIWKIKDYRKKYVTGNNIEKIKKTRLKKYGDENYNNRIGAKETCLKKYGVDNILKRNDIRSNWTISQRKKKYPNLKLDVESYGFKLITSINDFINDPSKIKIKCDKGHQFETLLSNWYKRKYCVVCSVNSLQSKPEREIHQFLKDNNIYYIPSCRNIIHPLEIDIYLPDYNLAIEFDGLYWHNDNNLHKNYHITKTNKCKEKNIELIHIFENEWLFKKDIVKSVLLTKLGKIENKIYARKCKIKEIDNKTKNKFLEENHLQGDAISSINLGLFYNDKLISVMTFGKRKITGKILNDFEMLRFCTKINYQVIGGFSKILKYFINNYDKKVFSYVDKRYFNAKSYLKNGFQLIGESEPNYWWFDKNYNFYHRSNFQKHKLKSKLENFNIDLSEVINMKNNDYMRIWDCGNYILKYER